MKKEKKLLSFHGHERYVKKANDLCYPAEVVCALYNCRTEADAERIMRKARLAAMERTRKANAERYIANHRYATTLRQQFA